MDERRAVTRNGPKKAEPVNLTAKQATALRATRHPAGTVDALLIGLFLDLGLRCEEVAGLTVENINLAEGLLIV